MWISKKKYNELEQSCERWKVLVAKWMSRTEDANKLAEEWKNIAVYCQETNGIFRDTCDKLLERTDVLLADLDSMAKQRDYYRNLLENTSNTYEGDKAISREAEE